MGDIVLFVVWALSSVFVLVLNDYCYYYYYYHYYYYYSSNNYQKRDSSQWSRSASVPDS